VTNIWLALFSMLTTLWRVASIPAALAVAAVEEGRAAGPIHHRRRPGSSQIPYQSASFAADRERNWPAPWFWHPAQARGKPRAHRKPATQRPAGGRHAVDPLSDPFAPGYEVLPARASPGLFV
jgi:hypothetical protein